MASSVAVFLDFLHLVSDGDIAEIARRLAASPVLATTAATAGATRPDAARHFISGIAHYVYAGDTPLHIAAAAFRRPVAHLMIQHGADCRARNRRGGEPLHYAADANRWNPDAQVATIAYLIAAGADPNAVDKSGVTPLHRAVRTRSPAAVRALIDGGANPRQKNANGSTPLHLAVQNTGRGGSGTPQAYERQAAIVALLLERGAEVADRDGRGRSVGQAATSARTQDLLAGARRA